MPETPYRFYELMVESPADLYKYTCLRLIPKLKEFEEPAGENNRHHIGQVRRWLTRFDQMFDEVQYDTRICNWKKMKRCFLDQEVEQRTTLIKWSRGIDDDFDYESHKKAMDHFQFDDNKTFTETDIIRDMKDEEEFEKQREEEGEADWDAFHKHHDVLMHNFCHYNDKLVKRFLLKKKHSHMSDAWKDELKDFWEDGNFDFQK